MTQPSPVPPTQTRHPWRATLRTVVAVGLALASLLPYVAATAHVDTVPAVGQVLAVAAIITRIMAMPGVEAFLGRFVPWLAAAPQRP